MSEFVIKSNQLAGFAKDGETRPASVSTKTGGAFRRWAAALGAWLGQGWSGPRSMASIASLDERTLTDIGIRRDAEWARILADHEWRTTGR